MLYHLKRSTHYSLVQKNVRSSGSLYLNCASISHEFQFNMSGLIVTNVANFKLKKFYNRSIDAFNLSNALLLLKRNLWFSNLRI